jgi:hypothetical protein
MQAHAAAPVSSPARALAARACTLQLVWHRLWYCEFGLVVVLECETGGLQLHACDVNAICGL